MTYSINVVVFFIGPFMSMEDATGSSISRLNRRDYPRGGVFGVGMKEKGTMVLRDFRCLLSGVSLMDTEAALVVLIRVDGNWRPLSLPIWGRYEGLGSLSDVQEGPNSRMILQSFQNALEAGEATVNWQSLGVEIQQIEHIESLFSLLACAQVESNFCIKWGGHCLGFSLLSANVVAALMEESDTVPAGLSLEALPEWTLGKGVDTYVYRRFHQLAMRLRCKFGISFVGLSSLEGQMRARGIGWAPAGGGIDLAEAQPAQWLAQAMVRFSESRAIASALEEHAFAEPFDE